MAVVTRNALAHGRRGALLTAAGIGLALAVHVTASALGLSALLRASAALFGLLRLVGGAYLAYLGVSAWMASRRAPGPPAPGGASPARHVLRQGFLSAVTNPKLIVFFLTFLPQFVNQRTPVLPQLLLLGLVFAAIGLTWVTCYGLLIDRVRSLVTAPRVRQWMERVTGTVLIGLGARLVLERI